jgi:hypothetical protein
MDFDLTALQVCFIPIMELERKLRLPVAGTLLIILGGFPADTMSTLVRALMRMAWSI